MKKVCCSKKSLILFLIVLTVSVAVALSFVLSNTWLKRRTFDFVSPDYKGTGQAKICFISDLHGKMYGENNSKLIGDIFKENPDIVCLDGDFIDADNTQEENKEFLAFVSELVKKTPVYFSYGNHDLDYKAINGEEVFSELENTGCTILEEKYVDISLKGVNIRLGGMFGYAFELSETDSTYKFLKDFTSTESTTILLCHRPDSFIYGSGAYKWNIDLILCGHTHGGLWKLPILGGLVAPEQGINPDYYSGRYDFGDTSMIISDGLSGYECIPRLFNRPEISFVTIH